MNKRQVNAKKRTDIGFEEVAYYLSITNTRSATERVVSKLKEKYPTEYGGDNKAFNCLIVIMIGVHQCLPP